MEEIDQLRKLKQQWVLKQPEISLDVICGHPNNVSAG
jgi:hypothetical protein